MVKSSYYHETVDFWIRKRPKTSKMPTVVKQACLRFYTKRMTGVKFFARNSNLVSWIWDWTSTEDYDTKPNLGKASVQLLTLTRLWQFEIRGIGFKIWKLVKFRPFKNIPREFYICSAQTPFTYFGSEIFLRSIWGPETSQNGFYR